MRHPKVSTQWAKAETDLAVPVKNFLEAKGFKVYQEVAAYGNVADMVGIRDNITVVVELKRSLTFEVLAQAKNWMDRAHFIYVGVPYAKRSDGRNLAHNVCSHLGIGLLEVRDPSWERFPEQRVTETVQPKLFRKPKRKTLKACVHEEQTYVCQAGSSKGGHYTPFKATCFELGHIVMKEQGISFKDALANLKHHYRSDATARACLLKLIAQGIVPGLTLTKTGKVLQVHCNEQKFFAEFGNWKPVEKR